jgi:menaquinone-dependent protoporphyrinogen oxidase
MKATKAREHRVFAGKLVKKQLSFPDRAIAAALRVPEGDFRDWDHIRAWAAEVAQAQPPGSRLKLGPAAGPRPLA